MILGYIQQEFLIFANNLLLKKIEKFCSELSNSKKFPRKTVCKVSRCYIYFGQPTTSGGARG